MTSQIVKKPQIRPKLITCSLAFWTRPSQFCPDNQTALWDLGLLSQSRFSSQILVSPSLHILENFNPRVRTNHLSSIIVLSSSFLQYSRELLRNKKNLSFQLTQKIVFTLTRLFYLLLVLTRQKNLVYETKNNVREGHNQMGLTLDFKLPKGLLNQYSGL